MKWKTFLQIVLLLIIAGIIFYIVCPKYHFDAIMIERGNKVTGQVEKFTEGEWR